MNRTMLFSLGWIGLLFGLAGVVILPADDAAQNKPRSTDQKPEAIDFAKARELFQKHQRGERLTADDEAYLRKAQAARREGAQTGDSSKGSQRRVNGGEPRETTGLMPLSEMSADDHYQGEDGGLYGDGRNVPVMKHQFAAEAELARIKPLNAEGQPAANGKIAFVSISMSNATQEFSRFKQVADRDPAKSPRVTIVDCAQGGQAMAEWVRPEAPPWLEAERRIKAADVSAQQVQVAWIKLANKGPSGDLAEHGKKLQLDTTAVIQNAKARFPNLRIAYLSSRIYGGYATSGLNPEPYAYESAFVVRWLIQDQVKGVAALNADAERGPVKAPLLLWGPYLWADGTTPRQSDKLVYTRDDLGRDGTHPSEAGRDKVARLMLEFFKTDELAKTWFVDKIR